MKRIIFSFFLFSILANYCTAQVFKVSFSDTTFNKPFTGKVLLYLSKDNKEPKSGTAGLDIFPCFSLAVENIKPGAAIVIDDKAVSFPVHLSDIERGEYYVQAVWDRNLGGRAIAGSPGNLYSVSQKINISKDYKKVYSINTTKMVDEPVFKETNFVKEFKTPSALLSKFYKRKTTLNAAVLLPKEYFTEPGRKFPVLFKVFGFGGDYHRFSGLDKPGTPIDTSARLPQFPKGRPLCPPEYVLWKRQYVKPDRHDCRIFPLV